MLRVREGGRQVSRQEGTSCDNNKNNSTKFKYMYTKLIKKKNKNVLKLTTTLLNNFLMSKRGMFKVKDFIYYFIR